MCFEVFEAPFVFLEKSWYFKVLEYPPTFGRGINSTLKYYYGAYSYRYMRVLNVVPEDAKFWYGSEMLTSVYLQAHTKFSSASTLK